MIGLVADDMVSLVLNYFANASSVVALSTRSRVAHIFSGPIFAVWFHSQLGAHNEFVQ